MAERLRQKNLEDKNVRCFVPMKYEIVDDKKQGKVRKVVPAISNLIFVYTTRENIQSLKAGLDYLQYLTMPQGGKNIPVTVPEKQMLQFMSVCETRDNRLVYVAPGEVEGVLHEKTSFAVR